MNIEKLKAAAQVVIDAQDATTHAIIAPSAEAFDGIVKKRERALTQAVYQLKQALKSDECESLESLAIRMGEASIDQTSEPFFSYCPEAGFETHKTIEEARDAAEVSVESFRDTASTDGWDDVVFNICYGVVVGGARDVNVRPMTDEEAERFGVAEGEMLDVEVSDFDDR